MSPHPADGRTPGTGSSEPLRFPELPQMELENLIGQLQARARDVLRSQGRLRGLLQANAAVASDLSLPVLLRRIVDAARDLVGARYAALGVVGRHGELEQFVHAGMADDVAREVGHLPRGAGILGVLTSDPTPLRLADLADHPASVGFPAHHPPMRGFLGVPIRVRDVVFGNLYLTEPTDGGEFTAEDTELVAALAATAGVAIENARLFSESEQRRRWSAAAGDVTRLLLAVGSGDTDAILAGSLAVAAEADVAFVARRQGGDRVVVLAAGGEVREGLVGRVVPAAGSLTARVLASSKPLLAGDGTVGELASPGRAADTYGPAIGVPLVVDGAVVGALCVVRRAEWPGYTDNDLGLVEDFATQAALALELGRARTAQQELSRLADRDRIARDLHDHVIQELYALGMGLESMIPTTVDPERAARLDAYVDTVDATIRRIRTTIFELTPEHRDATGLQSQLVAVVEQESELLGFRPAVVFAGALDVLDDVGLVDDIVAVVREALSNCARHAEATEIQVTVRLLGDVVTVEVADDGVGGGERPGRSSGLANLRHRAETRHGGLTLTAVAGGGTRLTWTARWPIDPVGGTGSATTTDPHSVRGTPP